MNKTPVYVAFRLAPDDECMLPNFIKYYKSLGVTGFFSNLNYRLESDRQGFESFVGRVSNMYPEIAYNIGPSNIEAPEVKNIEQVYELMKASIPENSYIIPADADEFHQYPFELLDDNINYLKQNACLYILGSTLERVSATGDLVNVDPQVDIFEQCPNSNKYLFSMPKISLLSNLDMYLRAGVGHHGFYHGADAELKKTFAGKLSTTHHFRWTRQGKIRTEKWLKLFTDDRFRGCKLPDDALKRLKMYDLNLLETNWPEQFGGSL
jgi:hypothetical protein